MVHQCYLCKIYSYKEEGTELSFHNFPKDQNTRCIWISLLGFDANHKFPKSVRICSKHFNENDFVRGPSGIRHLKKGAVPLPIHSLFNPSPSTESPDSITTPVISEYKTTLTASSSEDSPAKRIKLQQEISQLYYLPGPSRTILPALPSCSQDTYTTVTSEQHVLTSVHCSSSSPTVTASETDIPYAQSTVSTPPRKRKRYAGDLTSADFSSPMKAERNLNIVKQTVVTQKKKIHSLQTTVGLLRKRITNLNSLLKLLKNKSNNPN